LLSKEKIWFWLASGKGKRLPGSVRSCF